MPDLNRSQLSDEQRVVVDYGDSPMLVLASAGSGKTEVVAQRVERLLDESTANYRVLALSYTRRAASELRTRFSNRVADADRRIHTDTLHGFAHTLILQYGTWIGLPAEPTVLADDVDRVDLLEAWRASEGLEPLEDPKAQLSRLDLNRARGRDDGLLDDWSAALAEAGAMDYEAMLTRVVELLDVEGVRKLVQRLYRYVIVDEAQNLTASQYALLRRLFTGADGRVRSEGLPVPMLVGDDKQSIVGFAGASAEHMRRFAAEFSAREFRLTKNYRSARSIARLGESVARKLQDQVGPSQEYAAEGSVTVVRYTDERTEADAVAALVRGLLQEGLPRAALSPDEPEGLRDRDVAILARSAAALRHCATALQALAIPISIATHADDWLMSDLGRRVWELGTFRIDSAVSRRRVARLLGLESIAVVEDVFGGLQGDHADALQEMVRAVDPAGFMHLVAALESQEDGWFEDQKELVTLWTKFCEHQPVGERRWPQFELFVSRWQRGDDDQSGVRLQTVHRSQGREFKAVIVVGLNEGQFPDFRARQREEEEAELRAFYVAVTRPSRLLLLSRPARTMSRNGPWDRDPSRFLRLVPAS